MRVFLPASCNLAFVTFILAEEQERDGHCLRRPLHHGRCHSDGGVVRKENVRVAVDVSSLIIIIMAGMAVFLRGWLPHRVKAQMACNYCFPTRTMF